MIFTSLFFYFDDSKVHVVFVKTAIVIPLKFFSFPDVSLGSEKTDDPIGTKKVAHFTIALF